MKFGKKLLSCILVGAVVMGSLVGCGNKEASGGDEKAPIRVATSPVFPPCSYKDDEGNLAGFEHDAFEEIGKRCGRKIEWIEGDSQDALFGAVDSGKADTIAFQISINEDRKKNYDFSEVYGYNKIYLAVRDDFDYKNMDDLQGKKVNVPPAHSFYPAVEEYNKSLPEDKQIIVIPSDSGSMYEALEQGRYDACPITEVAFKEAMSKKPYKVKIAGDPIVVEENAYPFSKDAYPELVKDVNDAIKSMMEDGTMKKLAEKHYKVDTTVQQ